MEALSFGNSLKPPAKPRSELGLADPDPDLSTGRWPSSCQALWVTRVLLWSNVFLASNAQGAHGALCKAQREP